MDKTRRGWRRWRENKLSARVLIGWQWQRRGGGGLCIGGVALSPINGIASAQWRGVWRHPIPPHQWQLRLPNQLSSRRHHHRSRRDGNGMSHVCVFYSLILIQ